MTYGQTAEGVVWHIRDAELPHLSLCSPAELTAVVVSEIGLGRVCLRCRNILGNIEAYAREQGP